MNAIEKCAGVANIEVAECTYQESMAAFEGLNEKYVHKTEQ